MVTSQLHAKCIFIEDVAIDNSGINVLLVSASVEGASHTYSSLSWLAKSYCIYMGIQL